jgi:hypothetical protein
MGRGRSLWCLTIDLERIMLGAELAAGGAGLRLGLVASRWAFASRSREPGLNLARIVPRGRSIVRRPGFSMMRAPLRSDLGAGPAFDGGGEGGAGEEEVVHAGEVFVEV